MKHMTFNDIGNWENIHGVCLCLFTGISPGSCLSTNYTVDSTVIAYVEKLDKGGYRSKYRENPGRYADEILVLCDITAELPQGIARSSCLFIIVVVAVIYVFGFIFLSLFFFLLQPLCVFVSREGYIVSVHVKLSRAACFLVISWHSSALLSQPSRLWTLFDIWAVRS